MEKQLNSDEGKKLPDAQKTEIQKQVDEFKQLLKDEKIDELKEKISMLKKASEAMAKQFQEQQRPEDEIPKTDQKFSEGSATEAEVVEEVPPTDKDKKN